MLTHIGLQRNKETIPTFGVGVIKECFFIIVVSPNVNPRHVYYARLQNKCYRLMSEMVTMGDQREVLGACLGMFVGILCIIVCCMSIVGVTRLGLYLL